MYLVTEKKNLLQPLREKRAIRDFSFVPLLTYSSGHRVLFFPVPTWALCVVD